MEAQQPKLSKAEARRLLWEQSNLSWKLDPSQKLLRELFYNSPEKINTWLLARRSGKSYTLCALSIEACLKTPKQIVKFAAPTKKQVSTFIQPLMDKILEDCPTDLKPEWNKTDATYYFLNGSQIHLAGTDSNNAEKLRGNDADIAIVDEAGSCSNLKYIIQSILIPLTLITKGKIILASTPPPDQEHDFYIYIEASEKNGSLVLKTIYDNPRLTKKDIEEAIRDIGGIDSDDCQREYFCKIIKDSKLSVIPEFTEELAVQIVKEWPRPPFFNSYVAMDLGMVDLTVILLAYFDYRANKLIIEDELVYDEKDFSVEKLCLDLKEKEHKHWMNLLTNELQKPDQRVSDINYMVIKEISIQSSKLGYPINFANAQKDDKALAINNLRIMLNSKKIIIHPRCKTLITHLKYVKWGKGQKKHEFARSSDNGHYDAVDACVYLSRAINWQKNPYPANYQMDTKNMFHPEGQPRNQTSSFNRSQIDVFKKIFGAKKL